MKLKALSLGAALGFVFAVVPSCGTPTTTCGPNNCTGCCNAGACVTADKLTDATCGSAGNACSNCAASQQTCNMTTKSCIGSNVTGGGSSGTGGGSSGTGGGNTAGSGTGGGTANGGGNATGGGSATRQPCDILTNPTCPTGSECVLNGVNGSAGTCIPGACSVLAQNCTAPNTKCMVIPVGDGGVERVCTPFTLGDGGTADNAACQQSIPDSCQRGAQCVGLSGGGTPTCRRFCGPLNMCGAGSECNFGVQFAAVQGGASELHLICSQVTACNPFDQSPCQASEACQLGGSGMPICLPAGMVMGGGTCTTSAFCARGLQCVAAAAGGQSGVCRAFCNVDGGMPSCAAGMCQNNMGTGVGTCSM